MKSTMTRGAADSVASSGRQRSSVVRKLLVALLIGATGLHYTSYVLEIQAAPFSTSSVVLIVHGECSFTYDPDNYFEEYIVIYDANFVHAVGFSRPKWFGTGSVSWCMGVSLWYATVPLWFLSVVVFWRPLPRRNVSCAACGFVPDDERWRARIADRLAVSRWRPVFLIAVPLLTAWCFASYHYTLSLGLGGRSVGMESAGGVATLRCDPTFSRPVVWRESLTGIGEWAPADRPRWGVDAAGAWYLTVPMWCGLVPLWICLTIILLACAPRLPALACRKCGYSLVGVVSPRCPECGTLRALDGEAAARENAPA